MEDKLRTLKSDFLKYFSIPTTGTVFEQQNLFLLILSHRPLMRRRKGKTCTNSSGWIKCLPGIQTKSRSVSCSSIS